MKDIVFLVGIFGISLSSFAMEDVKPVKEVRLDGNKVTIYGVAYNVSNWSIDAILTKVRTKESSKKERKKFLAGALVLVYKNDSALNKRFPKLVKDCYGQCIKISKKSVEKYNSPLVHTSALLDKIDRDDYQKMDKNSLRNLVGSCLQVASDSQKKKTFDEKIKTLQEEKKRIDLWLVTYEMPLDK